MNIAQLFEKQDSTGLTPDQYKAQELARKQAGAAKYAAKQANTAGAGAMGNIAKTLTPDPNAPTTSSTGGTTTPTATGQTHAASATNPNQPTTATTTPTTAPAGDNGAVTGLANTVAKASGGLSKAVGAVGGGIAGALGKMKQGFQAGKAAVGGPQAAAGTGSAPATGAPAVGGDNQITQLVNRVNALEKAVGIAESYKFESKFLKMDI